MGSKRIYKKPDATSKEEFSTDKPMEEGHIYLIEKDDKRKVFAVGQPHNLTGKWKVKMKFEDKRGDKVTY